MSEGVLMLPDVIPPAADPVALAPQEAKRKVLEHWQRLDALARRRFPKDENLAHEGLHYVMDRARGGRMAAGARVAGNRAVSLLSRHASLHGC